MTGYKIPPKDTQFKPGKSGNPKGRPKGRKNTYTELSEVLSQKISITMDGKPVKINKRTAILLQAVNRAVKGELRAIQHILPYILAIDAENEHFDAIRETLSTNDQEILKNLKERLINEQNEEEIDV